MLPKVIFFGLYFAFIFIQLGCDTTNRDWQKAKKTNTIEAFQEFRREYPGSKYDPTATKLIEVLAWKEAKQENSITSYEEFLKNFSNSEFARIADSLLADLIEQKDWQKTLSENTREAYEKFLLNNPYGRFVKDACAYLKVHPVYITTKTKSAILKGCGDDPIFFTSTAKPINKLEDLKANAVGIEGNYMYCIQMILFSAGLVWNAAQQDVEVNIIGNAYFDTLFSERDNLRFFIAYNYPEYIRRIERSGGIKILFLPTNKMSQAGNDEDF